MAPPFRASKNLTARLRLAQIQFEPADTGGVIRHCGAAEPQTPAPNCCLCFLPTAFCLLHPVPENVESEFDLVADADQSMESGGCFDMEIAPVDREFSNCAQVVS